MRISVIQIHCVPFPNGFVVKKLSKKNFTFVKQSRMIDAMIKYDFYH